MALPTVTVSGKLRLPNGDVIGATGKLIITLSTTKGHATDDADGSVYYTVTGSKKITPDSAGDVSFSIVPNDVITPAGTYYNVLYIGGGEKVEETWTVASSPDPVDLQQIPKSTPAAVTAPHQIPSIAALPTPGSDYSGVIYVVTGPPQIAYICLQAADTTWSWVPIALGG
jgi:hypothetical protein